MSQQEVFQGLDKASEKHEKELVVELASDRILHFLGVYFVILLALVTKISEITGHRASCFQMSSKNKSDLSFVKHVTNYCWESSTTTKLTCLDATSQMAEDLQLRDVSEDDFLCDSTLIKRFIQWMPYALLFEAFLFAIPMAWWHFTVGGRLMGHIKFIQLLFADIHESVKTLPAGIYTKTPYDKEGSCLNCWGYYTEAPQGKASKDSADRTERNESLKNLDVIEDNNEESGESQPLITENVRNDSETKLFDKDNVVKSSSEEDGSNDSINKLSNEGGKTTVEQEGTTKSGISPGEDGSNDSVARVSKDGTSSVGHADTTKNKIPSNGNGSVAEMSEKDKDITVINEDATKSTISLNEEGTVSELPKKNNEATAENKNATTGMIPSNEEGSGGLQSKETFPDPGKIIKLLNQQPGDVSDVVEAVSDPNFVWLEENCKPVRERNDALSEEKVCKDNSRWENFLVGKMTDRHIFSMLCYENFAPFEHQPFLKSVHQLTSVPKYESDEKRILPLKYGILRQFCHDENLKSLFLIKAYMYKCISSILISLLMFLTISGFFIITILPTFRTNSFLCQLPHHDGWFDCTLTGIIDIQAAFIANWIVVTIYLMLSILQFIFVRFGADHKLSHFFDDIKNLSGVALVAAYIAEKKKK